MGSSNSKTNKFKKLFVTFLLILSFYLLAKSLGINKILTDVKNLREFIEGFGLYGYVVFILLYALSSTLLLPGSILTISAGIIFGPIKGAIAALTGAYLTMGASFVIARFATMDILSKIDDNKLFKKINMGMTNYGVSFLILTRLVPIFPFSLQNYAYGLTKIKFSTYMITSCICIIPGTFMYAYLAGEIIDTGISVNLLIKFTVAGVIMFIISMFGKYFAKKKNINIDEYK